MNLHKQHMKDSIEAFRRHYEDDDSRWSKNSGAGSNPYYTVDYRAFLDKFIRMNVVRSIVDIGCGDWQFTKFLNLSGIDYIGYDVVPSVVERNAKLYSEKNVRFEIMPDDLAEIPAADLLIMKDVLQHLPDQYISEFRDRLFPKFRYCLLTNSFLKLNAQRNVDIRPGQFRCLDLSAAPYNFNGAYVFEYASPIWEFIRTFLLFQSAN